MIFLLKGGKFVCPSHGTCRGDRSPVTTEQIIHPNKYFYAETEKEVEEPVIEEKGWQRLKNERFGEYFILVMLSNWISGDRDQKAAQGWGGDNFTYYERGSDYLFTWSTSWDSVEEAFEFCSSFQEMMPSNGAENKGENLWEANGRYLSVRWKEDRVIISGSMNETAIKSVLESI